MSKLIVALFVILFAFYLCGCSTLKNTALGIAGVAKGIADDTYNTCKAVGKADQWFRENCW